MESNTTKRKGAPLVAALVGSVEAAREVHEPFYHLEFSQVFPNDIYLQMMQSMPGNRAYRALPGRNNVNINEEGTCTRVKIDLFREYIRHFSADKKELWGLVGDALCSREVQEAFVR